MKREGKTALVTGAARGIGRGIAEVFAEQGADVAINDIDTTGGAADDLVSWIRSKSRRSMAVQADVSDRAALESMFKKVWNELGPIDILVNNAGIETIIPFLEITDEQWTRLNVVTLRGGWRCYRAYCRRAIAEGRKGAIVHIGSIQAA